MQIKTRISIAKSLYRSTRQSRRAVAPPSAAPGADDVGTVLALGAVEAVVGHLEGLASEVRAQCPNR